MILVVRNRAQRQRKRTGQRTRRGTIAIIYNNNEMDVKSEKTDEAEYSHIYVQKQTQATLLILLIH